MTALTGAIVYNIIYGLWPVDSWVTVPAALRIDGWRLILGREIRDRPTGGFGISNLRSCIFVARPKSIGASTHVVMDGRRHPLGG
jgi:hypothetical protein